MTQATGVEREVKVRLPDAAARRAVLLALGHDGAPGVRQVNHLYDTRDGVLRSGKYLLRLREEPNATWLTAKGPTRGDSRDETEVALTPALARRVLSGQLSPLEPLRQAALTSHTRPLVEALVKTVAGRPLLEVGAFTNGRVSLPFDVAGRTLTLEVDETTFPGGGVDYELELELPPDADGAEAARALEALLERAKVKGGESSGKTTRFYRALEARGRQGGS